MCCSLFHSRNGQWYYLSSMANMGLGNNVNALNDIREAVRLEPDNAQYQMLLTADGRRRKLVSGDAESIWRHADGRR